MPAGQGRSYDRTHRVLDSAISVRSSDRSVAARLDRLLTHLPETSIAADHVVDIAPGSAPGRVRFSAGAEYLELSRGSAVARLFSSATQSSVLAFDGLAVHAGVVAHDGQAVAFAAASGTGKSTLTAACLLAGFGYLSDEALAVRRDGGLVAYPKPVALGIDGARALGLRRSRVDAKDLALPMDLGSRCASADRCRLTHVIELSRTPTASNQLDRLAAANVVTTLLGAAFNAYVDPDRAVDVATTVASDATAWRLDVGDPHEAASRLAHLVGLT